MAHAHTASSAFAEAEEVIEQLIVSYASTDDGTTINEVHRMIEDTMNLARQREARAQDTIRGECSA
jgi:hypothetical protein